MQNAVQFIINTVALILTITFRERRGKEEKGQRDSRYGYGKVKVSVMEKGQ